MGSLRKERKVHKRRTYLHIQRMIGSRSQLGFIHSPAEMSLSEINKLYKSIARDNVASASGVRTAQSLRTYGK